MRIAIQGAGGRMGRMLIEAVLEAPDLQLAAAIEQADAPQLGQDAGALLGVNTGVRLVADLPAALAEFAPGDCLIDFTRPLATMAALDACVARGVNLVIGTTGFDTEQQARLRAASQRIAILASPNMSVGVNVVYALLERAASLLGEGYDVEIIEAHHRHKVDAPSGTALRMGEVVAQALGRDLAQDGRFTRHGQVGARSAREIGFAVVRGGDVVGDHTVLFAGTGERIEITHKSSSRMTYAMGALRGARYLRTQRQGLFDMRQVLGL